MAVRDHFEQLLFTGEEVFSPPPILDIGVHSTPFDDASGYVGQQGSMEEEPAILSIEPAQARFQFTWLARSQHGSPEFEQLRQIIGMDYNLPSLPTGFVNAKAGVFAPALIDVVGVPVRKRGPYQSGKRIDNAAELVLHSTSFVTVGVRDFEPF